MKANFHSLNAFNKRMEGYKIYIENTGLQCVLCVPGKHAPNTMKIIAKVYDGRQEVMYTFGKHVPLNEILKSIPYFYTDRRFLPREKVKGITKGIVTEVTKQGEQQTAIILSDGTVMMKEKENELEAV